MTKTCIKCGEDKPLSEYYNEPKGRYGKKSICKKCKAINRNNLQKLKRKIGECQICDKPSVPGKANCEYHLRKDRGYRKNAYRKRVEQGRCIHCSIKLHEQMDRGKRSCLNCRERLFEGG